ncbi:MAG: ABC transporter permease [Hyphomicrobiales bacterium]
MAVAAALIPARTPPPLARKSQLGKARIIGVCLVAFWVLAGVGLGFYLTGGWNDGYVAKYAPRYVHGIGTTIALVSLSVILGAVLSVPVAFGRMSKKPVLSLPASAYVYLLRGTPLISQLFLIYYGLGTFHEQLEAVGLWVFFESAGNCALFAFILNTSAYQAEILRGAIESVSPSQREAATALGLKGLATLRKIILPQALMVALRPYGNEIILMLKGSAVVGLITVYDIMGETQYAYSHEFDLQFYFWAAIFYLIIVEVLRNILARLERRLTRHLPR